MIIIVTIIITTNIYWIPLIRQAKHFLNIECVIFSVQNPGRAFRLSKCQSLRKAPKVLGEPNTLWPLSTNFLLLILPQTLWPIFHSSDTTSGSIWALAELCVVLSDETATQPTFHLLYVFTAIFPSHWGSPKPLFPHCPMLLIPILGSPILFPEALIFL